MKHHLFSLLKNAVECLEQQKWNDADNLISKVLEIDQKNFQALQLKGIVMGIKGEHRDACNYFKKALKIDDGDLRLLFNYSKALFEDKNIRESLRYIEKVLNIDKSNSDAWLNYGNCLAYLKRNEEALHAFRVASQLNPNSPNPLVNQTNILNLEENFLEAVDVANQAIKIDQSVPEAWFSLGNSYHGLKRYDEAIYYFDKAVELRKDYFNAYINRGAALNELRRYHEALVSLETALVINPKTSDAWLNKGFSHECLGDKYQATLSYQKALLFDPANPQANLNLGVIYLSELNFNEGWNKYSYRFETKNFKPFNFKTDKKKWDLKSSGKKIYLWGEQGIGDQILHCSLLGELDDKNTYYIGLSGKLIDLLKRSYPKINFYPKEDLPSLDFFDLHAPLGDLLSLYRNSASDFKSQRTKFLTANHEKSLLIKNKLKNDKKIIGISWFSSNGEFGKEKSIALEKLKPLFELPDCIFVDLQYGDTSKVKKEAFKDFGNSLIKIDEIDNYNDIDGLASLIDLCDYVVTVSNTTAHLSGGLGKPTYLLLPNFRGRLWYWHESKNYTLWYPSVRIVGQDSSLSWSPVIDELCSLLKHSLND
jgi:tetratricopeptide (TPR) repeat protein